MTEFTKGPWEACDRGDYSDFDGNSQVILGDDMRIAVVQNHDDPESYANARLIAAAPTMFEALKAIQTLAESCPADELRGFDEIAVMAVAALKRAEGKDHE